MLQLQGYDTANALGGQSILTWSAKVFIYHAI
jgi:hypothetical protein